MKITGIRFVRVTGRLDKAIGQDEGRPLWPADVDPVFAARPFVPGGQRLFRPDGVREISATFVFVDTDTGISGTSTQIGPEQVRTIQETLRPWLIGRDPLAIEENWDFMFRLMGGRRLHAAAAIDCALWDIRGRAEGAPVYELLGGPKQDGLVPYAGTVGVSLEPAKARRKAQELKRAGFVAQKWYPPCSVGHGPGGIEINLTLIRTLREAVGDEVHLMFDAHQGWTVEYAVAMARGMKPFRPRWLEEPVMADDLDGYRAVREAAGFPIAGSEAHSNRWQALAMLRAGVVDVYQPDECGTGGITELVRIAKMVADHGKQMVVHCGYLPTMHLVAALPRDLCPYYEYLVNWNEYGQWFYRKKCEPANGRMPLPPGPGLGLELDDERIETREDL
jgi:L-alanine-DL-glutamate epimerase-like enolase superfamily enzyme